MRLSLLFAKRYLFSRKSHSVINIISGVSSFTVAIPVMAMVILLSVFNGFESLVKSMYRNFDPDLEVTVRQGKFFDSDMLDTARIQALPGVIKTAFVLEENALFEYRERQYIGTMKGVDPLFGQVVPIENMVTRGEYRLKFGDIDQALVGQGVAYNLMIGTTLSEPLWVYMPRRGKQSSFLPIGLYRKKELFPSGIFALDSETDSKYVIVPIDFARNLLEYDSAKVSSLIILLEEGMDPVKAREEVGKIVGDDYLVRTRFQQKEELYRLMLYEKWGIYFIILMVLVIASFSIVGSLIMIIIDKKKDTETLLTLGADRSLIRRIFIYEGLLISGMGTLLGLILGISICLLQQEFGFVKMAGTSFLVDAYPVEMKLMDIVGVVISVWIVNYVISWFTVSRMVRSQRRKETIK